MRQHTPQTPRTYRDTRHTLPTLPENATKRLLKALVESHSSAAAIFSRALDDIERDEIRLRDQRSEMDKASDRESASVASANLPLSDRLLTVKEARELLKIGNSTFYALVKQQKIKAVKIGCATRVRWSELERLIS